MSEALHPPSPQFDDEKPYRLRAAEFAARCHLNQVRRDGVTPYIAHPMRVAIIVAVDFGETDDEVLAAALLHDVIEDCGVDYDDLEDLFTSRIATIVSALSKDPRLPESTREVAYDKQLAAGPVEARLIKLADVMDNLIDTDTQARRRRCIARVERAIALADQDEPLIGAVQRVQQVLRLVTGDGLV